MEINTLEIEEETSTPSSQDSLTDLNQNLTDEQWAFLAYCDRKHFFI